MVKKNVVFYVSVWACVRMCVSVSVVKVCVCVFTHVQVCSPMWPHMEAQSWPWALSSVILHFNFGLPVHLEFTDWLVRDPRDLLVSVSPSQDWGNRHTPLHWLFMWLLGIWTQVKMQAQQAYYHHAISSALGYILFGMDKGNIRFLHESE